MNSKIAISEIKLYNEYKEQLELTKKLLEINVQKRKRMAEPKSPSFSSEPKVRCYESTHTKMVKLLNEERTLKRYLDHYNQKINAIHFLLGELPEEIREILVMKFIKETNWEDLESVFGYTRSNMDFMIRREISKLDFEIIM